MIEPSIGRIVWYFADHTATKGMKSDDDDVPFAAIVCGVTNPRLVNLLVIDHIGTAYPCQSVPLFQGDEEDDHSQVAHCEWMPFQKGQAAKTEAAERRPADSFGWSKPTAGVYQNADTVQEPKLLDPLGPDATAKWPERLGPQPEAENLGALDPAAENEIIDPPSPETLEKTDDIPD